MRFSTEEKILRVCLSLLISAFGLALFATPALSQDIQWIRQFGTNGTDEIYGLDTDASGVYVGGVTGATLAGQNSSGLTDAFVAKYDANGTALWTKQFGTTSDDSVQGVAAAGGNVYVAGHTRGTLPGQTLLGGNDVFLRKYDTDGNEIWTRQFGTAADDFSGAKAGASGVYVGGATRGAFPGETSAGALDVFVRKYDADGNELWASQFGSSGDDNAYAARLDANGNYYVAGSANGTLPGQSRAGGVDAYVAKFAAGAELDVQPESLSFSGSVGGGTERQTLEIGSSGDALSWTATATVLNGTGWLVATPPSGTATASVPSTVTLEVNFGGFSAAGIYQAEITIAQTGGGQIERIPVTAVVSAGGPRLLLSQSTFVFRTIEGGSPPAQTLRILNGGTGSLNWTISQPSSRLTVLPRSGTASVGGTSTAVLSVDTTGLSAGVYQDLLQVSAPGAANNPQLVTVTLHVAPAATPPLPELSSNGILFVVSEGTLRIPLFDLLLGNAGGGSATFQVDVATESGGDWLTVSTASGSIGAQGASINVGLNLLNLLTFGTYRARLTADFTPGGHREVEVVLVYSGLPFSLLRDAPGAAACAPSSMEMVVTSVGTGTVVPVSFPRPLLATVADSCGNPVSDATVTANVEGSTISLQSLGDGTYRGTWVPEQQEASVPLTFTALDPSYPRVDRTVTVSTAAAAGGVSLPVLSPDGVVEGAGFTPQRPLAPGGIVSLFGSRFAAADTAATHLPLDRSLGGVSVRVGGEDAPLYYAGPGQINAQVPYGVEPGNQVPVVVSVNGELTAPQTYQIAPAQPGIFLAGGGGAILDSHSQLINAENPAQRGDVLQIFATGLGETDPPGQTGAGAPSFSQVLLPVTVTIGGEDAPVQYQGLAPGYVGLYQVNVVLPTTVTPGDNVQVVIRQNGISSNPDRPATIPVQ